MGQKVTSIAYNEEYIDLSVVGLSKTQVSLIKEHFYSTLDRFNANNGKMTSSILSKILKIPKSEAELVVDYVDLDGDGILDDYDYVCMIGLFTKTRFEEKISAIFSLFDSDFSQVISKDELEKLVRCILNINLQQGSIDEEKVMEKMKEIKRLFFLEEIEMRLDDFSILVKEDEDFKNALKKLGILSPKEDLENYCEDLEMEYQKGKNVLREEDQEEFERRRLGLDDFADEGMFSEEKEQADEFMAVKPFIGVVKNSVPSNHKPRDITLESPNANLELEFVHGYRCFDTRNNIFYVNKREILFHSAGVGIVMDIETRKQKFNLQHNDDITCIDKYKDYVVTGQIGHKPIINLWSLKTMKTISIMIGDLQKGIAHVAFSRCGQYVAGVAMNDTHDIAVYDVSIAEKPKLVSCSKGTRDVILDLQFSLDSKRLIMPSRKELYLATFNRKGIKVKKAIGWNNNKQPNLCIGFLNTCDCVVGLKDGSMGIVKGRSITKIIQAHKSIIYAMTNDINNTTLFSGSTNGRVKVWDNKFNNLHVININDINFRSINPKVRALSFNEQTKKLLIGTRGGEIIECDTQDKNYNKKFVLQSHWHRELWGLYVHPVRPEFVTVGEDFLFAKWCINKKIQIANKKLKYQAKTCSISNDGNQVAIGCNNGYVLILNYSNLKQVKFIRTSRKEISQVKFSNNDSFLAVGAHDSRIYIYNVKKNFKRISICKGHHSTITHLDFSEDETVLQSNCTSYEILYWNVKTGKQDTRGASNNRDENWASWTCVLGWPVQGIYPPCSDGTDVNSVDRAHNSNIIATGDDFGLIKLFRYPNFKSSSNVQFIGHSSHVTNVRFSNDDRYLISVGGHDKSIFQWKFEQENDYNEEYEVEADEDFIQVPKDEDDYGMFGEVEEEDGAEMGANKNFRGQVDNSIPTDFRLEKGMEEAPKETLSIEYINGYRCFDARYTARLSCEPNKIVFASAALGVEMDFIKNNQTFFNEHEEDIVSFDIHPNREIAASGQMAKVGKSKFIDIFVWNIKTKEIISNLKGFHRRAIQFLRFSPKGDKLFSIGKDDDNSIAIYDWKNSRLIATSKVDRKNVLDLTFLGNDSNFITVGSKHIKTWSFNGSSLKGSRVSWKGIGKAEPVNSCCGLNKSNAVIGTSKGKIITLRGGGLSNAKEVHKGRVYVMYFDRENEYLFTGGQDGVVNKFFFKNNRLTLHKKIVAFKTGESLKCRIRALDVYKGQMLVGTGASELFILKDYENSSKKKMILTGHFKGELWGLSVSPNNYEYVTVGEDKTVRIWDIKKRKMLKMISLEEKSRAVHYSYDGNYIVVATMNGTIILFDNRLNELFKKQSSFKKKNQWIEEIKFSPDNQYIAFGAHGGASKVEVLKLIGKENKKKLKRVGMANVGLTSALLHLDWDVDSSFLVINSQAYELKFMSIDSLKDIRASSCKDIEWKTWTCKIGFPVQGIFSGVDGTDVNTVERSHNKQILATGDDSQLVKLFKYPSVVQNSGFRSYKGHASHVTRVRFSYDDNYLISTGGNDKTNILWKTNVNTVYDISEDEEDDFVIKKTQRNIYEDENYETEENIEEDVEELKEGIFDYEEVENTEFMAVKPWLGAIKPPSDFIENKPNQDSPPNIDTELEYIYGYRAKDCRNNLFYYDRNLFYYAAAAGINLNYEKNTQKFFLKHKDDIISMDFSKTQNIFATGELGPKPSIYLWEPNSTKLIKELRGGIIKGVCALSFSPKGDKLAAVCIDDNHMVAAFDVNSGNLISCLKGDTAKIVDIEWISDSNFVTVGLRHFKNWTLKSNKLLGKRGTFLKGSSDRLVSAKRFMNKILCGSVKGELQIWTGNNCSKVIKLNKIRCLDAIHITQNNKILVGGKGRIIYLIDSKFKQLKSFSLNKFLFKGIDNKIRSITTNENETELYVGIYSSQIFKIDYNGENINNFEINDNLNVEELMSGHYSKNVKWTNEVWGLWPLLNNKFLTVSDDGTLRLWNGENRKVIKILDLNIDKKGLKLELDKKTKDLQDQAKLRCVTCSSDENHIVVGCKDGTIRIISFEKWKQIKLIKRRKRWIQEIKYCPDDTKLAVGSHDAYIDIYDAKNKYKILFKMKKHSSYITHLDWSSDSTYLQSNCGAYELLFWDTESGRQLTSGGSALRDEDWATWSCVLGWPVQGIFQTEWDGTDINMVDRSKKVFEDGYRIIACSDDFSTIRLYRYPCLNKGGSKPIILRAHSSHVTNVKFNHRDDKIFSVGGEDQCIMQWKLS